MKRIALVVSLVLLAPAARPAAVDPPKLAVIIVVDQMRADYVERFKGDWTAGLKRLVTEGAWFTRAAYPYLLTVTCPGHATISTGTFPSTHGVFSNQWWDRESGQQVQCSDDPSATNFGYDGPGKDHNSGYRLKVQTLADRLRAERSAHVVTLSAKARSAIMLAGHGGDAVTWLSEASDTWLTSSAFAPAPVPEVARFIAAHPVEADFGKSWTPSLPVTREPNADAASGERPPSGWTSTFPHVLKGTSEKPDAPFRAQWDTSPFADAYLAAMAASLVDQFHLGTHAGVDLLGVSFTGLDRIGHKFGPRSQEVREHLARLDATLGALLDHLDRAVGRGRYVVALSADHGVTPIPEQLVAEHADAGRIQVAPIVERVEALIAPVLGGRGPHVAKLDGRDGNLYFAKGVYDQLRASPRLLDDVVRAIASAPGVAHVFRSEQLKGARHDADPWRRAAALSYVEGRSGDLVIAPRPGWVASTEAAAHGTASADDQRVPILFMGYGIKAGRYDQPVTPADIAPTLAALCGITLPQAEGRALGAALK
jgi:predicted AlkP superfamily pyrophosphatase or phosphodiesterase